ncbi:hypothetical protein [Methyloceanibacter sp.]|uniref:hypothetical protein n=1 Tax=Methyloceanibacter sp. TaxID=1965321 RepID=UPI002D54BA8A|nr:hypothetical protein [Methyloceanibacter sp.]HZP09896.1 hypothetical protein [Methyloceanibacter sp.]
MFGSTTPVSEHPVHRANAMLRSALMSEASFPRPDFIEDFATLAGPDDGPIGIAYPQSLVARLNDLDVGLDASGGIRVPLSFVAEPLTEEATDPVPRAQEEVSDIAPNREIIAHDDSMDEADAFDKLDSATQAHMLALVREFQRRQRQANLLVAGSIAAALLLTIGGFLLIAHLAGRDAGKADQPVPIRSTSIAWQRPEREASAAPKRPSTDEPLPIAARNARPPALGDEISTAQVILATQDRKLALAPLLGQRHARYMLLRGLPGEAELSAGERIGSGSWMIKDEELRDLSLSVGEAASGDYPVEIYLLDAGNAPQARRTLILRVEPSRPRVYQAGLSLSWASALLDAAAKAPATAEKTAPADSAVLFARAHELLAEGDIAGARLLLLHLAERGEGEAAFELARTFDADALAKLGASGIASDPAAARGWYERASRDGNAEAAERLKILASLPVSDPSD